MKHLLTLILFLLTLNTFSQIKPFKETIETHSSTIEIIRNSVYQIYEEAYKNKDSVWYSIHFIKDTTRLNTEGWKNKNGNRLGIWHEYNYDGQLLYIWDYEKGICEVNKELYPYHDMLKKMKTICDSLIISAYGQPFFNNHVKFEYDCYVYKHYKTKFGCCEDSMWTKDYLGSWTEPIKSKPNSFKFRYQIRLHKTDEKGIKLGIDLDSLGNYVPSTDDTWNNYGFEEVSGDKKQFKIDINKAINIAKAHGLVVTDSSKISEFLTWDNFKKQTFYNGQFRYYITDLTSKTEYTDGKDRKGIIYRFNVYTFNPWTGEFVEMKKMKNRHEWGINSGHWTGLRQDND